MYGKMKEHLSKTLAEIREAGLYKEERLIESSQSATIQVGGKEVLNFCANNYLGLANDPRLIKASAEIMEKRGYHRIYDCGNYIFTYEGKPLK